MDDELLEQFLIEGRDLVADAQAQLRILALDSGNKAAIDAAFRAVHTLKGSVGIFPMTPAERVLHFAEEVLDRSRKGTSALASAEIARLVAMLDQTDRWIDEMERAGALNGSAKAVADALVEENRSPAPDDEPTQSVPSTTPAWAAALIEREAGAIAQAQSALTAFRYAPDREAFFRGDDPLGLVAKIPDVTALAIFPAEGTWPAADEFDPFACQMVIEGLSAASLPDLQLLFRLVSDQLDLHPIDTIAATVAGNTGEVASVLRVDAARIDRLAEGVGELAIAANAFAPIIARADALDTELAQAIRSAQAGLERAVGSIQRAVSAVRLVPLGPTLRRLPRLVREIATELGKAVDFTLTGEQAEVDKQIADGLFEPLLHLVRNALDHGIEAPELRRAANKAPAGKLDVAIVRQADEVVITLRDDGAGIDPDRIRSVAIARGLLDSEAATTLGDAAALRLIFEPGFSTAEKVSGVSGRGVGMDAVQSAVDRLRGRIEIDSRLGEGTTFRLRLPANALTTRLLLVEIGPDRYAVPFDQIRETVRVDSDRLVPVGTGWACVLRDRTVPVLDLATLLGGSNSARLPAHLLVTAVSGEPVAVRVDRFGERIDAMIRTPTGLLANMPSVAGTAVTGDGGVLLVLDLAEVMG